jgi:catechol 2,3-dioxygenase-like lactoylglutathione lyase family enzyme
MDAAYARLRRFKVKPISTEPQRIPDWNQAAAGIRAFYFRDPDNHALELIYFPPGKGDPRWQRRSEALFLGIDHTAIAVGDTEQSLKFYRDLLGLKVAGESTNYGMEQEYLNHVAGARVRITGLRAPKGPGLEFLEYLAPRDGRPYPQDSSPNDLWNWQTTLFVQDLGELFDRLRSHNARLISPDVADIASIGQGVKKAALVRDPDGHALRLLEQ